MDSQAVRVALELDWRVRSTPGADAGKRRRIDKRLCRPVVEYNRLRHRNPIQTTGRNRAIVTADIAPECDEVGMAIEWIVPSQLAPHLAASRIDVDEHT